MTPAFFSPFLELHKKFTLPISRVKKNTNLHKPLKQFLLHDNILSTFKMADSFEGTDSIVLECRFNFLTTVFIFPKWKFIILLGEIYFIWRNLCFTMEILRTVSEEHYHLIYIYPEIRNKYALWIHLHLILVLFVPRER